MASSGSQNQTQQFLQPALEPSPPPPPPTPPPPPPPPPPPHFWRAFPQTLQWIPLLFMYWNDEHILDDCCGEPVDPPYEFEFTPGTYLPSLLPTPQFDPANMRIVRPPRVHPTPAITSADTATPTGTANTTDTRDPHPPGWRRCDDCAKAKKRCHHIDGEIDPVLAARPHKKRPL